MAGKSWNFVKFIKEVSLKWKSDGSFRVLHSTLWQDENSSKIRTLYWNFLAENRNCKMKYIVWTILRIFWMLNQFAVGIPTLRVDQCHSHLIQFLKGCWDILFMVPSRREGPRSIWDTHGISRNVFENPDASSSAPYPQELHQWKSSNEELLHSSTVEKSERPEQNQDQRCQSGQSAKDSVILSGGDSSKNYGADQQRLQISDLHFDKFLTPATFACWKIRFKTEVCTCYGSNAMDQRSGVGWFSGWNEIFVIYSWYFNAEFLKYLVRGLLQHWTKSSIIPTTKEESVWRNKRPRKRTVSFVAGRLLTWSAITFGSLEPTILSRTTPTCSLIVFEMTIFRNSILSGTEFYLFMTKIPSDDILEGLHKLTILESEKFETVLELYDLEIHQKKLGPDYHRLKSMVKRSIEQDLRDKNFGARNGNCEKNAVVKNQGTKQLVQKILGDCWQRAVCERRQLQFPSRYE